MTWMRDFVPEPRSAPPCATTPTPRGWPALSEDEELWLRQLLDRLPDALDLDADHRR